MQSQTGSRRFSLEELCSLTDTSPRTVRFYIQKGLVARPEGEKRGAYYTPDHLEQLLFIRRWQQEGLPLERIGELMRAEREAPDLPAAPRKAGTVEVWSRLFIDEGVELHFEPSSAGLGPEQVRRLLEAVTAAYRQIRKGGSEDGGEPGSGDD